MKIILSKLFISSIGLILVFSSISFAEINQGNFVGAWLFDDADGQKAMDLTSKSGSGTLHGDPKWVDGKIGRAIDFDGKNDYVDIKLPEIFNDMSKNSFTISFWIYVQDISGSGTIWTRIIEARFDNSNYLQFVIQINDGELGVNSMVNGSEMTFIVNSPIKVDTWYYVTGMWEAAQKSLKLYLDGVLQLGKGTTPASPGTEKILTLGRRSDGNEETYFNGIIDEFAILNVAMTEDDIKNLMVNGLKVYAAVSSLGKLTNVWGNIKIGSVGCASPHRRQAKKNRDKKGKK